jgi:hypothetical protein
MTQPDDTKTQPDDELASMLRAALRREADTVQPTEDGLARILDAASGTTPPARSVGRPARSTERPARRPSRRGLPRWVPVLAAAATVAVLAAGLGAVRIGLIQAAGLARLTGAAPAGQARTPAGPAPLPVYFVAYQRGRWALVREFEPTTATAADARLSEALRLAVRGQAGDPDLTSVWAVLGLRGDVAGTAGTGVTPGGVTVRLSRPLLGAGSLPRTTITGADVPSAGLAVQQLVWTATAVTGTSDPVELAGPDTVTPLLGSVPLGRAYPRAGGQDDPRAPIWISSISDGQRMVPGPATISGDAMTTTAGSVSWSLIGPDGTVAESGTATLTHEDGTPARAGERAVWRARMTLPAPGRYQLQVGQTWPDDPRDALAWTDTKTLDVVAQTLS